MPIVKRSDKTKAAALEAYATVGTLRAACEAAKVTRKTLSTWMDEDSIFAQAMDDAHQDWQDRLVEKMFERGMDDKNKQQFMSLVSLLNAYRIEFGWKRQEMIENVMAPFMERLAKLLRERIKSDDVEAILQELSREAMECVRAGTPRKYG